MGFRVTGLGWAPIGNLGMHEYTFLVVEPQFLVFRQTTGTRGAGSVYWDLKYTQSMIQDATYKL